VGSVIANWTGRCLDRERQEDLCRKIEPLAVLSHSYFDEAPPIRRYDQALVGTILVSDRIFQDPPTSVLTIDEPPDPAGPSMELRVVGRPQTPQLRLTEAFAVSKIALFGTAFRLYDGRNLYPGEDEVSLVFATCDELPELTGQLVEVHDHADCLTSENETVRSADWYLTRPRIHLRYYLEEWSDLLFGSIKYFHVPDLEFWRYGSNPSFDELVEIFGEIRSPSLADDAYGALIDRFRAQVERWSETATSVRTFWEDAHASAGGGRSA
jgi:hypothetical protein